MRSVMKRMMVVLVIAAVLTVQMPGKAAAVGKPIEMTLNYSTILVKLHGKQTLKVSSVAPSGAGKSVKYEIANRRVASVTKRGVIKGKKIGVTTIRVTSKKNKSLRKLVKVIVAVYVPTKVKLSAASVKMKVDQKKTLKATVTPKKVLAANKKGTWISSDAEIVSISSKGVMVAHREGTATITFVTLNGKRAACAVTVQAQGGTPAPSAPQQTPAVPATGGTITIAPASGSSVSAGIVSGSAMES